MQHLFTSMTDGTETTEHDIVEERKRVILSICCVIPIVFTIWTLTVAQKARKEIQEDAIIEPDVTHTEVYEINMANSREEEFFKQTPGATSTDTLTVSQPGEADSVHHIGTVAPKFSRGYIPASFTELNLVSGPFEASLTSNPRWIAN